MVSWSAKRKFYYGSAVTLFLAVVFVLAFYGFFYKAPSCTDGKQNGDETGIDCGGSCQNICPTETLQPVVYWSKAFNISGNVYNIAAYVENPNIDSENLSASYEFKIFDDRNILLGARDGQIFIPKNKKFIVFEPGFSIPNRVPKYVEFKFTSFSVWQKDDSAEPDISITNQPISNENTAPKITGTVTNNSLQDVGKIELVALVEDNNENAVAVSRTFVEDLGKGTSQDFVFTWQKPFDLGCGVQNENTGTSTSTANVATSTPSSDCVTKASSINIIYRILP